MDSQQTNSFASIGGEPLEGSNFEAETPVLENPLTETPGEPAEEEDQ
jgi:hypothetical protein